MITERQYKSRIEKHFSRYNRNYVHGCINIDMPSPNNRDKDKIVIKKTAKLLKTKIDTATGCG